MHITYSKSASASAKEKHTRNWIPPLTGMDKEIILFEIIGKVNKEVIIYVHSCFMEGKYVSS